MKFSKFGRIALASVVSLGLGFGVIACGPPNTIDFLYVTSSKQTQGRSMSTRSTVKRVR